MTIEFTIPGKPVGKERPRFNSKTCRTYTPKKTRDYEELVRTHYRQSCGKATLDGYVYAVISAYFPIPKNDTKQERADKMSGKIKPTLKNQSDADNIAKAVLDALNGVAYEDDSAVVDLIVRKRYSDAARVEVYLMSDESEGKHDGN